MATSLREVSAQHIRTAGDRFIRLVHRIATQHYRIPANPRLRVNHRIAADNHRAAVNPATHIQIAKQNNRVPRQVSLNLHRAKNTHCIVHLLSRGDKDILPNITAIARCLSKRRRNKQQRKTESSEYAGKQESPSVKSQPLVIRRKRRPGSPNALIEGLLFR